MQPDQAANEFTEEQVLKFLVNILDEETDIRLGENADIDSETSWTSSSARLPTEDSAVTFVKQPKNHRTATRFSTTSERSLSLESSNESARHSSSKISSKFPRIGRWRPSPTSTSVRTMARGTTPKKRSMSHLLKLERPRSTAVHPLRAGAQQTLTLAVLRLTDGDIARLILAELLGMLYFDIEVKAVYLNRDTIRSV